MPIYPGRRPQTFRVVVWSRGKQHEEIFEGSKGDAKQHEARLRLALGARRRASQTRTAPLFSSFCVELYRPFAVATLGRDTWHKVRRYQVATLEEFFGSYRIDQLTTELVDEYRAKRALMVKASSVNNELRLLGTMLRWAREDRKLPVAELKIRKLAQGARRVRAWTSEQVDRLLVVTGETDPGLLQIVLYLLNTGCRKGEAIAAEWSWVRDRVRLLAIPVTEYWRPKSKRPREVPIGDALWECLAALPRSSTFIFPNAYGRRFVDFPNKRFAAVVEAAGLEGGPHTCRHTFASHFLQAVPDLGMLAELLGHSYTRTTELYLHLLPGRLERARNAVNLGPGIKSAQIPGETVAGAPSRKQAS